MIFLNKISDSTLHHHYYYFTVIVIIFCHLKTEILKHQKRKIHKSLRYYFKDSIFSDSYIVNIKRYFWYADFEDVLEILHCLRKSIFAYYNLLYIEQSLARI